MIEPRQPVSSKRQPGAKGIVLVIDDSDVDRAIMAELLESAGFIVHSLPSPIGATRIARQLQVQAVVIDQNLPAMDGTKLATLFRGNPAMRGIRVVLVSGNDDQTMLEIAKRAQVDAFVNKRDLHRQLVSTIKLLIA